MKLLILLGIFATSCEGFNNNPLLSNLFSTLADRSDIFASLAPSKPKEGVKDPAAVLRELNLQASTTPRLAFARAEQIPALVSASVAAVVRGASGIFASNYRLGLANKDESIYSYLSMGNKQLEETGYYKVPRVPLTLYEFEADAESRLVREACSMLSLTVNMYPIPVRGPRYRVQVQKEFERAKNPPFLYDPNTKVRIAGSVRIIDYLFATYGPGDVPWTLQQQAVDDGGIVNWPWLTAAIGVNVSRLGAGGRYEDSCFDHESGKPLTLWAYEGSPFCKLVREKLSAYELPHTIYYTPRGSFNRQRLYEATGRFQVPYLQDPNTGVDLFESEAIVEYLDKKYGLVSTPVPYM